MAYNFAIFSGRLQRFRLTKPVIMLLLESAMQQPDATQSNIKIVSDTAAQASLSVREVAVRWDCSDRHVRGLIAEGSLRSFRLGRKLIRVPLRAVVEFEQCQLPCESSPSAASTPPSSPRTESVVVAPLGLTIRAKWSQSSLSLAQKSRPEVALRSLVSSLHGEASASR